MPRKIQWLKVVTRGVQGAGADRGLLGVQGRTVITQGERERQGIFIQVRPFVIGLSK